MAVDTTTGSATAILRAKLEEWGLGALTDWALEQQRGGASNEAIFLGSRDTDTWKARFAGNVARVKAGDRKSVV